MHRHIKEMKDEQLNILRVVYDKVESLSKYHPLFLCSIGDITRVISGNEILVDNVRARTPTAKLMFVQDNEFNLFLIDKLTSKIIKTYGNAHVMFKRTLDHYKNDYALLNICLFNNRGYVDKSIFVITLNNTILMEIEGCKDYSIISHSIVRFKFNDGSKKRFSTALHSSKNIGLI